MTFKIVTGAWRRHNLFSLFCRYYKDLQKSYDFELIIACSEPETIRIAEKYGHTAINVPNQPLYRKFNLAAEMAKGADYVIMIGSDDFLTPGFLDLYLELFKEGRDYIYTLDWYFFDTASKRSLYWGGYTKSYNKGKACGAGRALSANLMDKMNWNPWLPGYDTVMDTGMQKQLDAIPHTERGFSMSKRGVYALDIKTEQNMTPFEQWDNSTFMDGRALLEKCMPAYVDEIMNL